jgi:hypothetical protein
MYGHGTRIRIRSFLVRLRKGQTSGTKSATEPVMRPRKKNCGGLKIASSSKWVPALRAQWDASHRGDTVQVVRRSPKIDHR